MEKLYIEGGKNLNGEVSIVSAKNAILPILAGSILASGIVVLKNIALFTDVINMTQILEDLGAKVKFEGCNLIIDSRGLNNFVIKDELSKKIRSSIFLLGLYTQ